MRYFAPAALPEPLWWTHRRMLVDALAGAAGVAVALDATWPFPQDIERGELRALAERDAGVAARLLDTLCVHPDSEAARLEVAPPGAASSAKTVR